MAGLLVAIGVMGVMLSVAMPTWNHLAKREREAELVFRGEQYMRAIELYQRQFVGAYPDDLDTLVEERFLRKQYEDPMAEDGEFQVIFREQVGSLAGPGDRGSDENDEEGEDGEAVSAAPREQAGDTMRRPAPLIDLDAPARGGVVGVVSRSREESLRDYRGARRYNEWVFIYAPTETPPVPQPGGDSPLRPRRGVGGAPIGDDRGRFGPGGSARSTVRER